MMTAIVLSLIYKLLVMILRVNYETIAGYTKLNDLLNYGYYTLKTNGYYRVFDSVSDGVTNFTSSNDISLDIVVTNYFTNALMTNTSLR